MARDPRNWMWLEALEMLAQAEHLQRQMFRPQTTPGYQPLWEPPVDVIEPDREVQVLAALPGVAPGQVEATIDQGYLIIAGQRILPAALRHAVVHRLELPQGRFQRRIPLPPGKYESVQLSIANGCLQISLQKA